MTGRQKSPVPDLRIAAIAIARNLTLLSGNLRRVSGVPRLGVEDWLNL